MLSNAAELVPLLLLAALMMPLFGFLIEILSPFWNKDLKQKTYAGVAVFCIGTSFVASAVAFVAWGNHTSWATFHASDHATDHATEHDTHAADEQKSEEHHKAESTEEETPKPDNKFSGVWYKLASFGKLTIGIEYYIDSLTLAMFCMVTLIATCIHIFAMGYMSDELTEDHVDHEVHTSDGKHFHRPGRYSRFFAYLSLFSFSMLGIVISGSILQVFIFWELVGVSSYLLIGFYIERKSASTAANKAFIMNRVGDFGFLIGLMVVWTYFGTFSFGGLPAEEGKEKQPGLFAMVADEHGKMNIEKNEQGESVVHLNTGGAHHEHKEPGEGKEHHQDDAEKDEQADQQHSTIPYWLLMVAGVGVFAGCIGKSAQFPLQTWLPDAMEGPTPVSALVHSATMVAAGVYLTARFSPMFVPEVLLIIAYVGCITLFLGATIALVATDIKRVLAYSTISQLGYMMLVLGIAGWGAGLYHLFTHAFFKSLMFLCAGSVIVGCHHVQEMPRMGGLLKKMPITGYTMLVGVIAICGLAIPGIAIYGNPIAFSGYHSKDAILANALAFWNDNQVHILLFIIPLITAGITAFYMFRLWFYTFWGEPRDKEVYDHVHESPWVMTGPLILLAIFAAGCAFGGEQGWLYQSIAGSEPAVFAQQAPQTSAQVTTIVLPGHHAVHEVHGQAGTLALLVAFAGAILAFLVYGLRIIDPADIKKQFAGVHRFLVEKWQFDEMYDAMFVRPAQVVGSWMTAFDRNILDGFLHWIVALMIKISHWDRWFDERAVDGLVNLVGGKTHAVGTKIREVQGGYLRQYITALLITVGALAVVVPLIVFLG